MRTWWFAIILAGAACGGTKKAPSSPAQGSDQEATEPDADTGARDENKPDDPDDMPSQGMDDPGDE